MLWLAVIPYIIRFTFSNITNDVETETFQNESLITPAPTTKNVSEICINPQLKDRFWSLLYNTTCVTCKDVTFVTELDKNLHSCGDRFKAPKFAPIVHIMNASMFIQDNNNSNKNQSENGTDTEEWCMLVNFYAPYCPFSARLAPFYNALPRAFPMLFVAAVDASQNSKINLIYGISGTPTLLLFHNGRPVARYESGDNNVKSLIEFVQRHTDLESEPNVDVQDDDSLGPLPSVPTDDIDFYLVLAWVFVILCSVYYFCKSSLAQRLFETLKRNWREMDEE